MLCLLRCKFCETYLPSMVVMMFQVENVILELNKTFPSDGLLPIYINPHRGTRSYSTITFGAMGDRSLSFYISEILADYFMILFATITF